MKFSVPVVIKRGVGPPAARASWSWLRDGLDQLSPGDCLELTAPEGVPEAWSKQLAASVKGHALQCGRVGKPVKYSVRTLNKEAKTYGIFRLS